MAILFSRFLPKELVSWDSTTAIEDIFTMSLTSHPPLKNMHGFLHTHEYWSYGFGIAQSLHELICYIAGLEVGKYKNVCPTFQGAKRVNFGYDLWNNSGVCLHLAIYY